MNDPSNAPRDAIRRLEAELSKDPASQCFVELSSILLVLGEVERALRICRQGVYHNPEFAEGYAALYRCHRQRGDLDHADQALAKAIACDPSRSQYVLWAAELALERGQPAAAVDILKKALNYFVDLDGRLSQLLLEAMQQVEASEGEEEPAQAEEEFADTRDVVTRRLQPVDRARMAQHVRTTAAQPVPRASVPPPTSPVLVDDRPEVDGAMVVIPANRLVARLTLVAVVVLVAVAAAYVIGLRQRADPRTDEVDRALKIASVAEIERVAQVLRAPPHTQWAQSQAQMLEGLGWLIYGSSSPSIGDAKGEWSDLATRAMLAIGAGRNGDAREALLSSLPDAAHERGLRHLLIAWVNWQTGNLHGTQAESDLSALTDWALARWLSGRLALELNERIDAAAAFRQALDLSGDLELARYSLASVLLAEDPANHEAARLVKRPAQTAAGKLIRAIALQRQLPLAKRDTTVVARALPAQPPRNSAVPFDAVQFFAEHCAFDLAQSQLQALIRLRDAEALTVRFLSARLAYWQGRWREADDLLIGVPSVAGVRQLRRTIRRQPSFSGVSDAQKALVAARSRIYNPAELAQSVGVIAEHFLAQGQLDLAAATIEPERQLCSASRVTQRMSALVLARAGDWSRALPLLERLPSQRDDRVAREVAIGRAEVGRLTTARMALSTLRRQTKDRLALRYVEAALAVAAERYQHAIRLLSEQHSEPTRGKLLLGRAHLGAGQLGEAEHHLGDYSATQNQDPRGPYYLAELYRRMRHSKKATAQLELALLRTKGKWHFHSLAEKIAAQLAR
ncbi:MAG: hypothetical protein H6707_04290 [Deltaproteobacteria bacterium]|nr:hypothetical protein [Deltaproteobacteria bacterium]